MDIDDEAGLTNTRDDQGTCNFLKSNIWSAQKVKAWVLI